jgi:hypothetical protein
LYDHEAKKGLRSTAAAKLEDRVTASDEESDELCAHDVSEHGLLSIEAKSCQRLPAWLKDAVYQAESCARDGLVPVIVLHEDCCRYNDAVVVVQLSPLTHELIDSTVVKKKGRSQRGLISDSYSFGGGVGADDRLCWN